MAAHTESFVNLTNKIRLWGKSVLYSKNLNDRDKLELKKYVYIDVSSPSVNGKGHPELTEKPKSIPFRLVRVIHECLKKDEGG